MYHITYFSSATAPFSKQDLLDILTVARRNNERLGITGILLYKDGNIMQVLEGEQNSVEKLYQAIERDPRHRGCIVIQSGTVSEREFGEWSMAFRDLADVRLTSLPGYNQYLNKPLALEEFAKDVSAAKALLQMFASGGL